MGFVPFAMLVALFYKITVFIKAVTNKQWNDVITQVIVWGAGIAGVMLFAASSFAGSIPVFDTTTLASMGIVEQVIIGLSFASVASAAFDVKKAIDNTDSAKTLPLTKL